MDSKSILNVVAQRKIPCLYFKFNPGCQINNPSLYLVTVTHMLINERTKMKE